MKISVIIPFWNMEKYLSEAVESVLSQTFKEWEMILIDDCSTDKSNKIAENYKEKFPEKIRLIKNDFNMGASASRNIGIKNSRCELIAFMDADDLWKPEKLEMQYNLMQKHPEAGMIFCTLEYFYDNESKENHLQEINNLEEKLYMPPELLTAFLRNPSSTPAPQATLIKKDVLIKMGAFEETFKEVFTDQSLWIKIVSAYPVFCHPDPLVLYRQHDFGAVSRALKNRKIYRQEFRFSLWAMKYLRKNISMKDEINDAVNYHLARTLRIYYKKTGESGNAVARFFAKTLVLFKCFFKITFCCGAGTAVRHLKRLNHALKEGK